MKLHTNFPLPLTMQKKRRTLILIPIMRKGALFPKMQSVHSLIRQELCSLVIWDWPEAAPDIFDMDCPGAEVSAPLGFRPGPDASWWTRRLKERMAQKPPMLLGERLLRDVSHSKGHVLFHISDEAYRAIIAHIIKNYPKPNVPDSTQDIADYAAARMLMLSRKGGEGCPTPFKRGVWLALCIEGFEGRKREAVRKRAARALLCAMDGLDSGERQSLRQLCGGCADCAARLLTINPPQEVNII